MKYIIEIKNGKHKTYYLRNELYNMGFIFRKKDKVWFKTTDNKDEIKYYKDYSKRNKLKYYCYQETYLRGTSYRKDFFMNTDPHYKNKYFCSYCGVLLSREELTVDHIIPIDKAKKSKTAKKILHLLKIDNINDIRNLTASCFECNSRKRNKLGFWIIKGFLGKTRYYWKLYYLVLFFLLIIEIIYVCFIMI